MNAPTYADPLLPQILVAALLMVEAKEEEELAKSKSSAKFQTSPEPNSLRLVVTQGDVELA